MVILVSNIDRASKVYGSRVAGGSRTNLTSQLIEPDNKNVDIFQRMMIIWIKQNQTCTSCEAIALVIGKSTQLTSQCRKADGMKPLPCQKYGKKKCNQCWPTCINAEFLTSIFLYGLPLNHYEPTCKLILWNLGLESNAKQGEILN